MTSVLRLPESLGIFFPMKISPTLLLFVFLLVILVPGTYVGAVVLYAIRCGIINGQVRARG